MGSTVRNSADILFFSADANRSESRDGKAWDRVLDPIAVCAEKAGFSSAIFAYPGSVLFGEKTFLEVTPLQQKHPSLLKKALRRGLAVATSNLPERMLGPLANPYARFTAFIVRTSMLSPYLPPLAKLKPKVVFATNANPLLCETAKALEIPVIEVLHARGYSRVYKAWETRPSSQLPNGVISYDEPSTEVFSKFVPVLQVPNYRYPSEKALARQWELSPEGSQYLELASQFPHVVTFTSTWSENHWGPEFTDGGIPIDLLRLVQTREDIFLQVRLHPVMRFRSSFSKRAEQLERKLEGHPRINFDTASTAPIYSILGISTVHITYESLAVYEAADDGLPSYYLRTDLAELGWASDLVQKGIAKPLAPTRTHIEAAIDKTTRRSPTNPVTSELDLNHVLEWARQL